MIDMYKVSWGDKARSDFKKMTRKLALEIEEKVEQYLAKSPRELGKLLTPGRNGIYSHRHGDYRILYRILESEKTIVISKIGHRREVYD